MHLRPPQKIDEIPSPKTANQYALHYYDKHKLR